VREKIVRVADDLIIVANGAPLYRALRAACGALNIEGATIVGDEVWFCHRGNTGPDDRPAIVVVARAAFRAFLDEGKAPAIDRVDRYDLGEVSGVRFGFTDAATRGDDVIVAFAAEASRDAIGDGAAFGSRIGVIANGRIEATDVAVPRGEPLKVEAIAFAGERAWMAVDCDNPDEPACLYDVVIDVAR
jgi:hypothetical protein